MRSPGQTFDFEGEMLTIAQIRQRVQIVSDASLRAHLAAGRNTASAILSHVPKRPKPSTQNRGCPMFRRRKPAQ